MAGIGSLLKNCVPNSLIRQKLDRKGSVLLTFDDGPHPNVTPRVLDLLEKFAVRGLFFIPGNRAGRAPHLLREIVERNHVIGNHGFTHTDCTRLSVQEIVEEIANCQKELFSHTGVHTSVFRPPRGAVSPSLLIAARYCRHSIMRWSFDSGEYSYMRDKPVSAMADNFLSNIHDRAIVLSHDDTDIMPRLLELVLPGLVDRGVDLKNGLLSLGLNSEQE